jgi:3-oxo-5-alpha-steroid 4-dehydrogenase 3 / polyprenol reductase
MRALRLRNLRHLRCGLCIGYWVYAFTLGSLQLFGWKGRVSIYSRLIGDDIPNRYTVGSVLSTTLTIQDLRISQVPSLRTLLCLPIFLMASGIQHDCHHYLSSLKEYTVPKHPLFQWVVCPHYTAECAIYLSLALLAAPGGEIINKSVLCGLLFVVVNLSSTAYNTEKWYKAKFGEDTVHGKWKMLPGIF